MTTDQLADFGTLVRLFRLLDKIGDVAPQNIEIAFEEMSRRLREDIHLRWNAEQSARGLESLARRVASLTGCDRDVCLAAAVAASSPSRAKVALAGVQELVNELERSGA
jgi:hypothetical protein